MSRWSFFFFFLLLKTISSAQITGGYQATRQGYVAYLRLTQAGKDVKGYFVQFVADDRAGYRTIRDDITGVVSGSSVMLKVGAFFGQGRRELDGTYRNGRLEMGFPTDGGEVIKLSFTRASVDTWNQTLANFKKKRIAYMIAVQTARDREATHLALEKQRIRITDEFSKAYQTVLQAQPAFLKWKKTLDEAESETPPLERDFQAAKDNTERIKTKGDELTAKFQQAVKDRDVAEGRRLQEEGRKLQQEGKEAVEEARLSADKFYQNKRKVDDAKSVVYTDFTILNQAARAMLNARREAAIYKFRLPEFNTPIGNAAYVVASKANTYSEPNVDKGDSKQLSRGTALLVTSVDGEFYGFVYVDKKIGWIRNKDVKLADDTFRPPREATDTEVKIELPSSNLSGNRKSPSKR